jgi:zinc D-Ala-D-Ala dipeptidase
MKISAFSRRVPAWLVLWCLLAVSFAARGTDLPSGFVDVATLVPGLRLELRYLGSDNFVGRPVDGYLAPRCILTRQAAQALAEVQGELKPFGLGIKVFDAYRPQRAVDHFVRWARDSADVATKARYYPRVEKADLFRDGYIAERSGHSRGSTVDLTLVALSGADAGAELDMGSGFDWFGVESWPDYAGITSQQRANRLLLHAVMVKHGFRHYPQEWWHFTLKNEPFPDTYFDFPVR